MQWGHVIKQYAKTAVTNLAFLRVVVGIGIKKFVIRVDLVWLFLDRVQKSL